MYISLAARHVPRFNRIWSGGPATRSVHAGLNHCTQIKIYAHPSSRPENHEPQARAPANGAWVGVWVPCFNDRSKSCVCVSVCIATPPIGSMAVVVDVTSGTQKIHTHTIPCINRNATQFDAVHGCGSSEADLRLRVRVISTTHQHGGAAKTYPAIRYVQQ